MPFGYIYILANKSLPYLKIGYTKRNPEQRASELSSTGVPTPFYVAYKVYVEQVDEVEKLIHKELREYRVSDNREFFNIDLSIAVSKTDDLISKLKVQPEVVEPDDENFDPLKLIAALRESQYINEKEEHLLCEDTFNKKVNFFKEIYNSLKKINGTLTGDYYSNIFYALEINEDSKIVSLYEYNTIPELPNGIFINKACIPFNEDKSPQTEVKRILSTKKWASEENIKMRDCHTDHFNKLIKEMWNEYKKENKKSFSIDRYSADFHFEKCFEDQEYWENLVSNYCIKNNINDIVCKSWKNVSWNCSYVEDDDEQMLIDELFYKKICYLKKICCFSRFERMMTERIEEKNKKRENERRIEIDLERKNLFSWAISPKKSRN